MRPSCNKRIRPIRRLSGKESRYGKRIRKPRTSGFNEFDLRTPCFNGINGGAGPAPDLACSLQSAFVMGEAFRTLAPLSVSCNFDAFGVKKLIEKFELEEFLEFICCIVVSK
jgi:hypothetical protein